MTPRTFYPPDKIAQNYCAAVYVVGRTVTRKHASPEKNFNPAA
jgi:hypothetical protein